VGSSVDKCSSLSTYLKTRRDLNYSSNPSL
jgi:hypothetical protein